MQSARRPVRIPHDDRDRNEPPRLIGPHEVAAFLGVPLRTVYRWRTRGDGPPGYRVGRHVRYRHEDVELWLEQHRDRHSAGEAMSAPTFEAARAITPASGPLGQPRTGIGSHRGQH